MRGSKIAVWTRSLRKAVFVPLVIVLSLSASNGGRRSLLAAAYNLDPNSTGISRFHVALVYRCKDFSNRVTLDSIKSIAKTMTADMMSFYTGNQPGQTPGLLPAPYYCKLPTKATRLGSLR
jgi:hypothetical protein